MPELLSSWLHRHTDQLLQEMVVQVAKGLLAHTPATSCEFLRVQDLEPSAKEELAHHINSPRECMLRRGAPAPMAAMVPNRVAVRRAVEDRHPFLGQFQQPVPSPFLIGCAPRS